MEKYVLLKHADACIAKIPRKHKSIGKDWSKFFHQKGKDADVRETSVLCDTVIAKKWVTTVVPSVNASDARIRKVLKQTINRGLLEKYDNKEEKGLDNESRLHLVIVCLIIMGIDKNYDVHQSTCTQIKIRLKDSRYYSDRFCWKK
jgi:hypothetical protein